MHPNQNGKVLILGNDTRSFLSVIRSLGRKGLEIHIGWCDPKCPARFSRYVKKYHHIPGYLPDRQEWEIILKKILESEKFDLVIPCNDQSIIPLQVKRRAFAEISPLYLLEDEVFKIVSDKYESWKLAKSLAIPVPQGFQTESWEGFSEAIRKIRYPAVLKPLFSFTARNIQFRQEMQKVMTLRQAEEIGRELITRGPILVQENFIGIGAGVELIADHGEILAAFQHERVHEPLQGGGSSYRKSVKLDRELYDATAEMMRKLHYSGVAMVEFKINPKTNEWVFMEINGRFWGSLPLAMAAGVDFPWYLYELRVHGERKFPKSYRAGLYGRNWTLDIEWFRANLQADHSDPLLLTIPVKQVLSEVKNIFLLKERNDALVWDDPFPGIWDLLLWGNAKFKGLKQKLRQKCFSLGFVRRRFQGLVGKRLKEGNKVVFVCMGNIYRSPFAENYLKLLAQDKFDVISCGLLPEQGRACPNEALEAAKKYGLNLGNHRSVKINQELVENAAVIFIFDRYGYERLVEEYPSARSKAFYVGVFFSERGFEIEDPNGFSVEKVADLYGRLAKALRVMNSRLGGVSSSLPGEERDEAAQKSVLPSRS